MKIRPLRRGDISSASKIIGRNYSLKYQHSSIREMNAMFDNKVIPPKYFVAEENEAVIGCGGYIQSWMDYTVYNIFWINVMPEYQRKGIGTKMVGTIIAEIKRQKHVGHKAGMILLSTDKPRFYKEKFGFKVLSRLQNKYSLMGLKLFTNTNK